MKHIHASAPLQKYLFFSPHWGAESFEARLSSPQTGFYLTQLGNDYMICFKSYLILDALMCRVFPLRFCFFCFFARSISLRVSEFILRETVGGDGLIKVHQSRVPLFLVYPQNNKFAARRSLIAHFIFLYVDAWITNTSPSSSCHHAAVRNSAFYYLYFSLFMRLPPLWQQRLYQASERGSEQSAILIDWRPSSSHLQE